MAIASVYIMKEQIFAKLYERLRIPAMDSQEVIKVGHEAKRETEAFINRHLNDRDKGWPKLCHCRSANSWSSQRQQDRRLTG
jgi:hypothetical protein